MEIRGKQGQTPLEHPPTSIATWAQRTTSVDPVSFAQAICLIPPFTRPSEAWPVISHLPKIGEPHCFPLGPKLVDLGDQLIYKKLVGG